MTPASAIARRYQLRQREKGLCVKCPLPLATANHCDIHAAAHAKLMRARRGSPDGHHRRITCCTSCLKPGHDKRTCSRRNPESALNTSEVP